MGLRSGCRLRTARHTEVSPGREVRVSYRRKRGNSIEVSVRHLCMEAGHRRNVDPAAPQQDSRRPTERKKRPDRGKPCHLNPPQLAVSNHIVNRTTPTKASPSPHKTSPPKPPSPPTSNSTSRASPPRTSRSSNPSTPPPPTSSTAPQPLNSQPPASPPQQPSTSRSCRQATSRSPTTSTRK